MSGLINGKLSLQTNPSATLLANVYSVYANADSLATIAATGYLTAAGLDYLNTGDKVLITTDNAAIAYAATARNDGTNVYLDFDNVKWLYGDLADVSTASTAYIAAPAGLITNVYGVLDTAITVASANVTFSLGGTAITGAALTFTTAQTAGTLVTAAATAANYLAATGAIGITTDGGSTTTSRCKVAIKMICAANIG